MSAGPASAADRNADSSKLGVDRLVDPQQRPVRSSSARKGRMDCCLILRSIENARTTLLSRTDIILKSGGLTVILANRSDLDLTAFYRVAWQRENVRIADDAMRRIAANRASFLELIDKDPSVVIYGVTTAMGERASHRLTREERDAHARIKPFPAATSFGEYLPDRVVRGIVFARLANFIEGHAATSPRIAAAVADMLDGRAMPAVAAAGQGGAGEILALYPLFAELSTRFDLEVKERGSLINGSPCAAALLADAAIAGRRRLQLALETFALSIEAFRAPLEHYDEALESLWGDPDEAAVLRSLRSYLGDVGGRRNYQAPVSYRIVPRVLGHAHRAVSAAERAARISLSSISDNPVYLPPDANAPLWPLHQHRRLSQRHGGAGARRSGGHLGGHLPAVRPSQRQIAERPGLAFARPAAGRTPAGTERRTRQHRLRAHGGERLHRARQRRGTAHLHPGSDSCSSGQDDVATPVFLAWSKEARAGRCLDASLAMLGGGGLAGAVSSPTAKRRVRCGRSWSSCAAYVAPVVEDRILGPELANLTDAITARIFAPSENIDS